MRHLVKVGVGLFALAAVLGGCDAIDEAFDPAQVNAVAPAN